MFQGVRAKARSKGRHLHGYGDDDDRNDLGRGVALDYYAYTLSLTLELHEDSVWRPPAVIFCPIDAFADTKVNGKGSPYSCAP